MSSIKMRNIIDLMESTTLKEERSGEENKVYFVSLKDGTEEVTLADPYELYGDDIKESYSLVFSELELINEEDDPDDWVFKLPNGQYIDTSGRESPRIVDENPLDDGDDLI